MTKFVKIILIAMCLSLLCTLISCKSDSSKSDNDRSPYEETDDSPVDNEVSLKDAKYAASKNSNKYHRLRCRYVDNIKPENLVYYEYEYEAADDGKSPCSECKP